MNIPERDGDGYLTDMNAWTEDVGRAMAEADGQRKGQARLRFSGQRARHGFVLCAGEELRIEDLHHRTARPTGDDYDLRVLIRFHDLGRNRAAFLPLPRVERRLPAACRRLGHNDLMPEPLEDAHHADAHLRIHQVHEARNEE